MTELFSSGQSACAGCPMTIIIKHIMKAAGENTIISNATSCSEIVSTAYPNTAWRVPYIHTAFECAAATASGVEAACKQLNKDANVIVIAGDGGTYDIGLQSLSGMVDRGHNILYICYDNECYANTGVQRSSATPFGAWTTTSPKNKTTKKKIAEMMIAQGCTYVATSSVAYPRDIQNKVKKALAIKGPKFLLIHAPCPLAWKFTNDKTIDIAKLAVETRAWIMYEYDGKMKITMEPKQKNIDEYIKAQARFKGINDKDIIEIQDFVNKEWERLKKLC